jgi:hypothetical protein
LDGNGVNPALGPSGSLTDARELLDLLDAVS